MAETYKLKVVTPDGVKLEDLVTFIKLPGMTGELGILPGHSPLLARLVPGEVLIRKTKNIHDFYFIASGTVQVIRDNALILTPYLEHINDIDIARAERALHRAKERLTGKKDGINLDRARAALERADARIHLYNTYVRKS